MVDEPITVDAGATAEMMRRYSRLRSLEGFESLTLPAEHLVLMRAVMLLIGLLGQLRANEQLAGHRARVAARRRAGHRARRAEAEFFAGRFPDPTGAPA